MQNKFKTIAIYCGSHFGNSSAYSLMANQMATAIVNAGLTLIYGGAKVGLMGVIADTVLKLGGKVIGVIPESLVKNEISHEGLTELHIVQSMHARKSLIADTADGFVMLPGGPGTLEEFFEILTWAKLGHHQKPCGILNVCNYYDLILKFLDHTVNEKFFHAHHREMVLVADTPQGLLQKLFNYMPSVLQDAKLLS